MGGGTAGAVAATRPDLIRGVVLEDPALGEDPSETLADRLRAGDERVDDAQLWHDDPEKALAMGLADNEGWPPGEYPGWARSKTQTDLSMLATGQARVQRSWLDVAAEIAAPALMLACDDPLLWDEESLARLRGVGNPRLRIERVPGAGHCIRRSQPEAFHALVDPWLAEHA
jgi:pimeloyl-ACP methyl ester carboxylesterase